MKIFKIILILAIFIQGINTQAQTQTDTIDSVKKEQVGPSLFKKHPKTAKRLNKIALVVITVIAIPIFIAIIVDFKIKRI